MSRLTIRHLAAKVLNKSHYFAEDIRQGIYNFVKDYYGGAQRLVNKLFHAARDIDDKVPCPYCGLSMALIDLEKLKTYCFGCSFWGQDPRGCSKEDLH